MPAGIPSADDIPTAARDPDTMRGVCIDQSLPGGNVRQVVRVANTVRRSPGMERRGIHALLRYLTTSVLFSRHQPCEQRIKVGRC